MNRIKVILWFLVLIIAALALSACRGPGEQAALTETPTATLTAPPAGQQELTPCAFTWATQSLPEVSQQVQSSLEAAGLSPTAVRAEAYGENCVEADGTIRSFSAMETDFHLQLSVADLSDQQALGDLLEKVLVVIDQFPPGKVPGPQTGYIGVEFSAGQDTLNLWFTARAGQSARTQGLHGADLVAALTNK